MVKVGWFFGEVVEEGEGFEVVGYVLYVDEFFGLVGCFGDGVEVGEGVEGGFFVVGILVGIVNVVKGDCVDCVVEEVVVDGCIVWGYFVENWMLLVICYG